jgi:hypothetical protein
MQPQLRSIVTIFAAILIAAPCVPAAAAELLPDAPVPQVASSQNSQPASDAAASESGSTQDSSSSQSARPEATAHLSTTQPPGEKSRHDAAAEQIQAEEKQRVLGIVPSFNTTYVNDAVSLSPGQKMQLAFRSAIDPFTFAGAFLVAGFDEAADGDTAFGTGSTAFFQRVGAAYLDSFNGVMIGNGILPVLLHQDPRYFRLGHGSVKRRTFYAMAASFICKHDNTGRWEPNYSNIGGNIAAGAISNLYYPNENSGWGQTLTNGFVVTAEGAAGSVFQEFWPDISRKLFHKDPTHGLDAQAAAADEARKK